MRSRAKTVAGEIAIVQQAASKPVIFTEVGFKSITGTSVRPWEWPRRIEPAVNMEEQARCYQAVLETFWNKPWFYGLYWWKWYSDLDPGSIRDGDFTPRGKPAEQVLSEWYRKPVPLRQTDRIGPSKPGREIPSPVSGSFFPSKNDDSSNPDPLAQYVAQRPSA